MSGRAARKRILTDFQTQAAHLRKGGEFTDAGLTARLVELAQTSMNEIERAGASILARARQERAKFEERLAGVPGKSDPVRETFVATELVKLPDPERWAVIETALQDGDAIVLGAVLGMPKFIQQRMMLPDMLATVRDRFNAARDPETAANLARLNTGIEAAERALRNLRSAIANTKGLPEGARTTLQQKIGWIADLEGSLTPTPAVARRCGPEVSGQRRARKPGWFGAAGRVRRS